MSPEAPVPVVVPKEEYSIPGGAGNVAMNISTMGSQVTCLGAIGNDIFGEKLIKIFNENNISSKYIETIENYSTSLRLNNNFIPVDVRVSKEFDGGNDFPTQQEWSDAVTDTFDDLSTQNIGYDLSGSTIHVYSKDCSDDLRGKKLQINNGVSINIRCEK